VNSLTTVESVSVPDAEVIEADVFVRSTTVERLDIGPILCGGRQILTLISHLGEDDDRTSAVRTLETVAFFKFDIGYSQCRPSQHVHLCSLISAPVICTRFFIPLLEESFASVRVTPVLTGGFVLSLSRTPFQSIARILWFQATTYLHFGYQERPW